MRMRVLLIGAILAISLPAYSAENLKLNQQLDFSSDSQDGPLITGDHLEQGAVSGKPSYVIIYGEGCFNSKRQARRTVELYEKYKGRVQFVVVDMDRQRSAAQEDLVKRFYKGHIPHVVILNRDGKIAYNASGEVEEGEISKVLDKTLKP
jgi:thiol-disulfide isomerase/thioredoxin